MVGLSQTSATKTDICQYELYWVRLKVYLQKHLKSSKHCHCIFTLGHSLFFSFFKISFFIQKSYVYTKYNLFSTVLSMFDCKTCI